MELLWPTALESDDAFRFLRDVIERLAAEAKRAVVTKELRAR